MTAPVDLSRAQRHVMALKKHALAGSIGVVVYCEQLLTMYPGEVAYVMRDLGLKLKDSDDEQSIIARIVRAISPAVQETSTMKASQQAAQASTKRARKAAAEAEDMDEDEVEEEDEAPAKKSKKSKKAKAAADDEDEGEESAARGGTAVGETLTTLLGKGTDGRKLAQRLADGEDLSAKQLGALQAAINEAATEAREEENGKKASQLSSANRIVRRMRRAAE